MYTDFVIQGYQFLMGTPPTVASVLQGCAALLTIIMIIMAIVEAVNWGRREWALRGTLEPFQQQVPRSQRNYWS